MAVPVPLVKPGTLAVTPATVAKSSVVLLMSVIGKVAEVAPAGIVTVPGTVSRAGRLDARFTVTGASAAALIVTVPGPDGAVPSVSVAGNATLSIAVSLSFTVSACDTRAKPGASAVMFAICVPSSSASSTIVTGKFADVLPAGIITVAGTVASAMRDDASVTTRSAALDPVRLTVADIGASPSVAICVLRFSFSVPAELPTAKTLLIPLFPDPTAVSNAPAAASWIATFPVHTPLVNAPLAPGVIASGGLLRSLRFGRLVVVSGVGLAVPFHVSGSP